MILTPEQTAQLLAMAHRVARRFARHRWTVHRVDYDDLVQVAFIGGMKGLRTWQPGQGASLRTWVWRYGAGEVRHFLRDGAMLIRLPRKVYESRVHTLVIESMEDDQRHDDSGDFPRALKDIMADHVTVDPLERIVLRDVLLRLPRDVRKVFTLYHEAGYTQTEIATLTGWSQKHISRMLDGALRVVRELRKTGY